MDAALDGGFATAALDGQTCFRAIMDALANPGTIRTLVGPSQAPDVFPPGLASVLLTLADADTQLWLSDTLSRDDAVAPFVRFHTGAPLVSDPGRAAFAFALNANELPSLDQFNLGSQEYPDRSSTIVLAVPDLAGGAELLIRGPGIRDHGHIAPLGLPEGFVGQWQANRELFPRGIDLILVSGDSVLGLPRSTRIAEGH